MNTSRRSFLKKSSAAALPLILPASVRAAGTNANGRINMGFIGTGNQGQGLLRGFLGNAKVRVLAVCDVDTTRRDVAVKRVNDYYKQHPDRGAPDCAAYVDFRELITHGGIDAVCIATPDHWHTIPIVAALRAGMDVYCEKPLTHNIHESITVIKEVKANGRVLQTGSMQRSSKEFRVACELVRNGAIGKISHVDCSFGPPGIPCDLEAEEMEPGLDWDFWVGPGPMRAYSSVLSPRGMHNHFPHWRNYKEYGGGMVCDWGAHHIDIAQWGLGMDESGPVAVRPPADPNAKNGAVLTYASGIEVHHVNGFGVQFFGADGEVRVNRGRFEFYRDGEKVSGFTRREDGGSLDSALIIAEKAFLKDAKVKLYQSGNHLSDFIECVESRNKPITSEIVGGRTAICCHLMNQAYYNHAEFKWNPKKLRFAGGTGKPEWLTRDYRGSWNV